MNKFELALAAIALVAGCEILGLAAALYFGGKFAAKLLCLSASGGSSHG